MVMVVQSDSLKVCTTIVPMCWTTTTTHSDMKLTEDGKSDDGDVGGVAAKR
jgi:hypothetical protein